MSTLNIIMFLWENKKKRQYFLVEYSAYSGAKLSSQTQKSCWLSLIFSEQSHKDFLYK